MTIHTIAPAVRREVEPGSRSFPARAAILAYGLVVYALFFGAFLYLIAFVGGLWVPRHLASGAASPLSVAIPVNLALIALFGAQYAVMARRGFKSWITRFIPHAMERSTFVLATVACLAAMFVFWRPMPQVVWESGPGWARVALWVVFASGWGMVLFSSFIISHFDLFGVRQVVLEFLRRRYEQVGFRVVGPYKLVRHPLMLGFLLAFWSTPTMTAGGLLFAAGMSLYILIGVTMEERDLLRAFGEHYRQYRRHVPAVIPSPFRRWKGQA